MRRTMHQVLGALLLVTCVDGLGKIREKDLTVITLHHGKYTAARRTSPVPQLSCLSNCKHAPQTVQCKATGWDGEKLHWKCDAMLPEGVQFGSADVNCEGYDYPDDPYVTIGSCGLTYTLTGQSSGKGHAGESSEGKMPLILIGIVFCVLLVLWCGSDSRNPGDRRRPSNDDDSNQRRGFYGGSGGFGDNTTPGFRPDYYSSGGGCGGNQQPAGNAGGFWSGLATGGLAGYMFGRNNNAYGYGGGNYDYVRNRGYSSGLFSDSGASSSGASTSQTRSASAFASTSRR
ncbi:store-operated calcium entry-associated regulatory factor-like [Galendromus occidentalis]|uniref:Store-operated calcium entry-associated regulatory factor n=1 Tax=Galendromus occidentalis TaxID=34638 RepID=A0AAJ6VX03_9ACAR|nr:store-operated calcium entry-associated regulatory factor-like [Galendromus occidentalis]